MLSSILPHNQDSTQQQPNNQQQQAQDLMRRYFDLPVELQKLYAGIVAPVAEVAYGDSEKVLTDEK